MKSMVVKRTTFNKSLNTQVPKVYKDQEQVCQSLSDLRLFESKDGTERILIVGPTLTGKTTLIKHIVDNAPDFDYIILFGANSVKESEEFDREVIPSPKWTEECLDKLWKLAGSQNLRMLFIFDDVSGDNFGSMWFKSFISSCRHQNISCIWSLQYPKSILPLFREQMSRVFITNAREQTRNALIGLLSDTNKQEFKELCGQLKLGKVLSIDKNAWAEKECTFISVPEL